MPDKGTTLIDDLYNVPSIIGALGLAVGESQKLFNLDYLRNVKELLPLAESLSKHIAGEDKPNKAFLMELLKMLLPSRYQFTETTLVVRMDLAQSLQASGAAGLSFGYGAVAINAAMSVAYGKEYRAAAEVTTVLHAIPADLTTMTTLLGRPDGIKKTAPALPEKASLNEKQIDAVLEIAKLVTADATLDKPKP